MIPLRAPRHTDDILEQLALGAVATKLAPAQRNKHAFTVNGRSVAAKEVLAAVDIYATKLARKERPPVCDRTEPKTRIQQWYCTVTKSVTRIAARVTKVVHKVTTWAKGTKIGKITVRFSKRALQALDRVPFVKKARELVIMDKSLVQGRVQVDVSGPVLNASKVLEVTDPSLTSALHWGTIAALSVGFIPSSAVYGPLVALTEGVVHRIAKAALLPFVPLSPGLIASGLGAAMAGLAAAGIRLTKGRTPLSVALAGTAGKLGAMTFLSIWPVLGTAARAACVAATFKRPVYELVREIHEPAAMQRVLSERLATRAQTRRGRRPQQTG